MNTDKPKYFISVISTIVALVIFFVCYLIAYFVLAFIIDFLWDIPILGFLLKRLLSFRGDSTGSFICTIASLLSAVGTLLLMAIINKHEPTFKLTCAITGVIIMVIHILSGIINLISGVGIWVNLMQCAAGFIIFANRN